MFGKMNLSEILRLPKGEPLQSAVTRLMDLTDGAEIARWIEFPRALLLFVMVPGDAESGAPYVLDRKSGTWYMVDFEDDKYGGYSEADFECLMKACRFARLIEQPQLLETCRWRVALEEGPELLGAVPRKPPWRKHGFDLTRSGARA